MNHLKKEDPQIYRIVKLEEKRQKNGMELIAAENYVSEAVLEALGTVFTNKYSEGYPGKRYYGGQDYTDALELLAIERAKKLFKSDHANVQPLSGAPANVAAYFAWLEPGDTILGMDLTHGGHLTHGSPVTYMAKLFKFVRYKMKDIETGEIDYDELLNVAKKEKPKIILAGFSAYPREYNYTKFKTIADEVGAIAMADIAHIAGLIAAGVLKNPFDYGFQLVTTTTHKTLRGPRGGMILTKGKVGNPLKKVEKTVENLPTLIDRSVFPGFQGGPHMNSIAAKAVAFGEALRPSFKTYAKQVVKNAIAMADELMKQDCKLITNGTENHLMVIDCARSFGISGVETEQALDTIGINGKEVENLLDTVGITTSKSTIPDDTLPPFAPSGLRLGTPAMTTRGIKEKESRQIARFIVDAVHYRKEPQKLKKIRAQVREMCLKFPVPGIA